jgi:tetratricopeptide (TPR) repeat protein
MMTVTSCLAASVAAARQQPALPELRIEDLPKAVRLELQEAYDRARTDPNDAAAVGRLGMLLQAHDQHRSAQSSYEFAAALQPRVLSWTYLLGVETATLGEYAAAARHFRAALTLDPEYLPARVRLADVLMAAGEVERSLAEYTSLLREAPDLPSAHYGLGRVAVLRGDTKAAIDHFRMAVDVSPQFGTAHYALALAYRDAGQEQLSEKHAAEFRRWGARRPVPPDPILESVASLKNTARTLLATASELASKGRLQEAVDLHLKALAADPTVAQAHVNLISLYGRLGQQAEAESHYRAAVSLRDSAADAHYNYGVLLASSGRVHDAVETFRKALDVNPFHSQAHNNLATLLAASGSLEEGVSHYRQALANDPMHRSARFQLVLALLKLGRLAEATDQSERLSRSEEAGTARLWFTLARAWSRVDDRTRARACAEEALRQAKTAGQTELAAEIERDLAGMKAAR